MVKFQNRDYRRNIDPKLENLGIAFVFEPTLSNNFLMVAAVLLLVLIPMCK